MFKIPQKVRAVVNRLALVLFVTSVNCEDEETKTPQPLAGAPDTVGSGENDGITAVLCPDEDGLPFALTLGFLFKTGADELPIPKGIHPGLYNIEVFAVTPETRGAEEVSTPVNWSVSNEDIFQVKALGANNDFAVPTVKKDIIDMPGKVEEPWSELEVCTDVCALAHCEACKTRVCSNNVRVYGLIDLSGQWLMDSAAIPFTVEFPVAQQGRTLFTYFEGYEGEIHGREVTFTAGEYKYVGIVADNRLVVSGTIVNWQTGEVIGPWTATRK